MSATSLMPNTCTLTPVINAQSSASAGMTTTFGTQVSGVTCGIQTSGGFEAVREYRETGRRSFNCYFPPGTTIDIGYMISGVTGSSIEGMSAKFLRVTSPIQDHAGRGAYIMVTAEEETQST